jgi:hypothetical protein
MGFNLKEAQVVGIDCRSIQILYYSFRLMIIQSKTKCNFLGRKMGLDKSNNGVDFS